MPEFVSQLLTYPEYVPWDVHYSGWPTHTDCLASPRFLHLASFPVTLRHPAYCGLFRFVFALLCRVKGLLSG